MAKIRVASPNEQRTISREHYGFYNAVVIGAVYEIPDSSFDVKNKRSFYGAVTRCINAYPTLCVVVRDSHTDSAFFERVPMLNLDEHIFIAKPNEDIERDVLGHSADELKQIEVFLPSVVDHPWSETPPPWRITVLPLKSPSRGTESPMRCFIAFAFSHALGDGMNGLTFHRTLKEGILNHDQVLQPAVPSSVKAFPAPFDTPENMPVSWGFLLPPLLGVLLPQPVTELLGLRASASVINSETWTGAPMFYEPETFRTGLKLIEIQASTVDNVLRVARKHNAKLTAVITYSLVRALSKVIPDSHATNFASGIAINMRRAVGVPNNEMGFFVSACFESHDRDDTDTTFSWSTETWKQAESLTEKLASCAMTLQDQPAGLLRYAPSISKWTAAKMGKKRDCSFNISNLTAFEDTAATEGSGGGQCRITKVIFTRSADATSSPIELSVVSVKDGSMAVAVTWQPGALGLSGEAEPVLVERLCSHFIEDLEHVAKMK